MRVSLGREREREIYSLDVELWNRCWCKPRTEKAVERHLIATNEESESLATEGERHRKGSGDIEEQAAAVMSRS